MTREVGHSSRFVFHWKGQHNDEQANHTFNRIDWEALLEITKWHSDDPTSAYEGSFHAGGRHIVRRITLKQRNELWLARIPSMPCPADLPIDWWTSERRFTMESEIATMKFVSQATDIPVPKVFAYDTGVRGNPVGLPYMLMECIEGNVLLTSEARGSLPENKTSSCARRSYLYRYFGP